ncbi:hypothetical protein DRJ19_05890, partial [Candidatus Woesearchaeota archaeon]
MTGVTLIYIFSEIFIIIIIVLIFQKMAKKVSIELPDKIVKVLQKDVQNGKARTIEEALVRVIEKALAMRKVKKAVILAGGKGTRMRPFTYEIPKPLIPVQGKPLVQHILDLLRKYDIRDVIFSIGYKGEKIKEYFSNGAKFGFNITYVEEEEELGTAGPLRLMEDLLDGTFLMFNGDILTNLDLGEFILYHNNHEGIATIALTSVEDPKRYGLVKISEDGKILSFMEKPQEKDILAGKSLINAGIYVMEPEIINYVPNGYSMLERDVFPKLAEEGKLYGYEFVAQWFDTGTHE